MNKLPTPRTDAHQMIDGMAHDHLWRNFAETLERELQQANDYADRLVEHKDMVCLPADLKNLREANTYFAAENEMLKNAMANDRDAARAEGIEMEQEIKAITEQRDMWKSNHDNQVKINQLLRDRPDLKDRSKSIDKLIEERESLQAQLEEAIEIKNMATETLSVIKEKYGLGSRNVMKELQHKVAELEKILKDCLYEMPCSYVANHTVEKLPLMIQSQAQLLAEEITHSEKLEKQRDLLIEVLEVTLNATVLNHRRDRWHSDAEYALNKIKLNLKLIK